MNISVHWLNQYLDPGAKGPVAAAEAEHVLTHAGFPIESRQDVPGGGEGGGGDARLDVEVTSNRGDALCHVGLAREIAACTGRTLKLPEIRTPARPGPTVRDSLTLDNTTPAACPRFTAHVIRGLTVGPSPAWLVAALEAVGQRSINNVVDATNFLNFELGQPAHVFDLAKLAGRTLVVRFAREGEPLTTLDGKRRTLKADELVVADAQRAQSLAGVIGGKDSEVTSATTDAVLEAATWDPVAIRRAARRHAVRTDASHRFERGVDPRTVEFAARRAAALIVEIAGGTLCDGMLDAGSPARPAHQITLRPRRCRELIGIDIGTDEMARILRALLIDARPSPARGAESDETLLCTIPPFRLDLTREVDLIEEVIRIKGLDAVPVAERLSVVVKPPQTRERAMRELGSLLTGLGFYETVTFSFVTPAQAEQFLAPGLRPLEVDDERRKAEPTLRPSILPSLLACRKANADAGVGLLGGVRLFETASTFAQTESPMGVGGLSVERYRLALLADVPGEGRTRTIDERQSAVRLMRAVVEAIGAAIAGTTPSGAPALGIAATAPTTPPLPGFDPAAFALVTFNDTGIGGLGLISPDALRRFDLDAPVVAAEFDLEPLLAAYPPRGRVEPLPAFPGIERDLSLIVPESTRWDAIAALVAASNLERLEGFSFVSAYRGKQVGPGRKSVTLRLRFRDPARTLRHEEVDGPVGTLVERAKANLGAALRQ